MRRLPARNVLVFSLMAALACLVLTVWLGVNHTSWALLPAALTIWFVIDSWRAWNWSRPADQLTDAQTARAESPAAGQTRPADR